MHYKDYNCDQIASEMENVSRRAGELHASLKKTANNDSGQMAVGMILFWPALFFLEGGDGPEAAEYARLKGEKEALEKVAVEKQCANKSNSAAVAGSPQLSSNADIEKRANGSNDGARDSAATLAKVGDKWNYRLTEGTRPVGMVSIEIIEVNGSKGKERITRDGYPSFIAEREIEMTFSQTRFLPQITLPGGYQLSEIAPYFPEETQLKAGTTWPDVPGEFVFFNIGKKQLLANVKVVSQETVTVPAGTFVAWKIEADVANAVGAQGYAKKLYCTFWYSPERKRTVKMQFFTKASIDSHSSTDTYELSSSEFH
jgi:hypothetical protein